MRYKLRNNYSTNPDDALKDILRDRGVLEIDKFLNPSFACELNPYDLDNIEDAVELLLKHLRANSNILFVVDADCDGFTSSSILWLYIKSIFPLAKLNFTVHEHKQHGLSDKIEWLENTHEHFDLVIVPDAGSYDVEYHQRLWELGTDVLCLDHHE
jgi:single-stranded-DNA-specific exonuclease